MKKVSEFITIISPGGCYQCGLSIEDPYYITINSIKSKENSWLAQGTGNIETYCRNCGQMYHAIMTTIPIECEPFKCPKCGKDESLKYEIHKINKSEATFEFEVEISCNKCQRKKSIKKIIKQILKIIKISISKSGVAISNS